MDFLTLSTYFGGCMFRDSLMTDLPSVRYDLETQEYEIRRNFSAEDRAAFFLKKAVFAMVRGKFVEAGQELDHLSQICDGLPDRWISRCKAYNAYLTCLRRTSPVLSFRPEAFELSTQLSDAEYRMKDVKIAFEHALQSTEQNRTVYTNLDKLEFSCLRTVTAEHNDFSWTQAYFNPVYPDEIPAKAMMLQFSAVRGRSDSPVTSLVPGLSSAQLYTSANQCQVLNIDAIYTRNLDQGADKFDELSDSCKRNRDYATMAMAYIVRGDHLSSPPTTNPIALNMIMEGIMTGYEIDLWDQLNFESQYPLEIQRDAFECYDIALQLLKNVKAPRIKGSVYLRKACVYHIVSLTAYHTGSFEDAAKSREDAKEQLNLAFKDFGLDDTRLQLVKAHEILLRVTDVADSDACHMLQSARGIGSACNENGNLQLSRFVTLLFLRFGRSQWLKYGSTGVFQQCQRCAEAVAEGSEDVIYQYQVAIAQTKFLSQVGAGPSAHHTLTIAQAKLNDAESVLERLRKDSGGRYANDIDTVKNMFKSYLASVANSVRRLVPEPASVDTGFDDLTSFLPQEYRDSATPSMGTLYQISREYNQALSDAQELLYKTDHAGYVTRLEGLLTTLESFDTKEHSIAGYIVRTLCLLGRFTEAKLSLPLCIPASVGGAGHDQLFDSISSITVSDLPEGVGPVKLSLQPKQEFNSCKLAIGYCVWTRDWFAAARTLSLTIKKDPEYLRTVYNSQAVNDWQAKAEIAAIYEHSDGLQEALSWYLQAVNEAERHREQLMTSETRMASMSSMNSSQLFGGLIRVALRMYQATLLSLRDELPSTYNLMADDWQIQAFLFAEQGRARALLDVLTINSRTDDRALRQWKKASHLHMQYEDLVYNSRKRPAEGMKSVIESQIEMHSTAIVTDQDGDPRVLWSRAYSLYLNTVRQHNASTLFESTPTDALVLHYNTFETETILFAITREGISRTCNIDTSRLEIQRRVLSYQQVMGLKAHNPTGSIEPELIEEVQRSLANDLLLPVQDLIEAKEHLIFILSFELIIFPMCSLPFKDVPLGIQKCCSTVPSLSSLSEISSLSPTKPPRRASVLALQDRTIRMADVSANYIAELLGTATIKTNRIEKAIFQQAYEDAEIVHLTTHGFKAKDGYSSWQAQVLLDERELADEQRDPLYVTDFCSFHTAATLVVFSACLGGFGRATGGNDVIGFSHAILQSGARCFIAALWEVNDLMTMLFMTIFYKILLKEGENRSIARCLHEAQSTFYGLTKTTAKSLLEEVLVNRKRSQTTDAEKWFRVGTNALEDMIKDLSRPRANWDFKDPYLWAAWVIVGNGDVCLQEQDIFDRIRLPRSTEVSRSVERREPTPARSSVPGYTNIRLPVPASDNLFPQIPHIRHVEPMSSFQGIPNRKPVETSPKVTHSTPSPPQELRPLLPPRPARSPQPSSDLSAYTPPPPPRPANSPRPMQAVPNTQSSRPGLSPSSGSKAQSVPYFPGPPASPAPPQQYQPQAAKQTQRKPVAFHRTFSDPTDGTAPQPMFPMSPPAHTQQVSQSMQSNQAQTLPQPNPNIRRVSLGGPPTAAQAKMQHQQIVQVQQQQQQQQPPKGKMKSKMKKVLKHPGTKIVGGLVLGSFVAEAISELGDYVGGSGGDAGGFSGGGVFTGDGADGSESFDTAAAGPTFEDNLILSGYGEQGYEQGYEDYGAGDTGGQVATTEPSGTGSGGGGGGDIPGQVGPCFEDNIILSRYR